ncbi:SSI family serine proteinase inhibitor [Gandjariella thermophila]|nr:SSI family serine proteinase inhibitor [Gandjariella thermophila]
MRPHRSTAGTLLAGTALLTATTLLTAAPGTAATRPAEPRAMLLLSVAEQGGANRTSELNCDPPGGTHPSAVAACADLSRAQGNFDRLPGDTAHPYCPMMYRPVTASAHGTWRGRPVTYTATYPNGCVLTQRTGPVFRF